MWTVTVAAGLLQTLAARFYISGDGNSYLDIASAYLRGDFANAINAYCSPFYSWLIALVLWVFKPSGYWETTILHLLNFAGLLVALRAFEFFFSNFLAAKQNFKQSENDIPQMPVFAWWILGYGLFLSATLEVLSMYPTSPDGASGLFGYPLPQRVWDSPACSSKEDMSRHSLSFCGWPRSPVVWLAPPRPPDAPQWPLFSPRCSRLA
jgi:hypothetical protein